MPKTKNKPVDKKAIAALKKLLPVIMKEIDTDAFQDRLRKHWADISREYLMMRAQNAKWRKRVSELDDEMAIFTYMEHHRRMFGLGPSRQLLEAARKDPSLLDIYLDH